MPWSITTWSFLGSATTVPVSGSNAILSGNAVYLEFDDTNASGQDFRWNDLNKQFFVTWYNGSSWVVLGGFTDPTTGILYWNLANCGISLTNQATGPQNVFKQNIGVEANSRFQWDTNGKIDWGPGGATAVDTTLQRTAAGILQTATLRGTAAPSNVADLTRKDYVDTAIGTTVLKAGSTMSGLLILSGDPATGLGAATKQYVDNAASKPTIVQATGSLNNTDYHTMSTTPVDVDATNLSRTLTIPLGWVLTIFAQVTMYVDTNGHAMEIWIYDTAGGGPFSDGYLSECRVTFATANQLGTQMIFATIVGDNNPHTVKLRFNIDNAAVTAYVGNENASGGNGYAKMHFSFQTTN